MSDPVRYKNGVHYDLKWHVWEFGKETFGFVVGGTLLVGWVVFLCITRPMRIFGDWNPPPCDTVLR